jgi:hypothetical protein
MRYNMGCVFDSELSFYDYFIHKIKLIEANINMIVGNEIKTLTNNITYSFKGVDNFFFFIIQFI